MFYFTADPHGDFAYIADFCRSHDVTDRDTLVILGDACFDRFGDERDATVKGFVSEHIPASILAIRGNHDPDPVALGYPEASRFGGEVLVCPGNDRMAFAIDGQGYDLDGISAVAIGGAYTVFPEVHLSEGYPVFNDSQPGPEQWKQVEEKLGGIGWKADLVMSHTCPERFIIPAMLNPIYDQSGIDHSFEEWLDIIEERMEYRRWVFGHFHRDADISERVLCLRHRILSLPEIMGTTAS